jgi:hypothetical protein
MALFVSFTASCLELPSVMFQLLLSEISRDDTIHIVTMLLLMNCFDKLVSLFYVFNESLGGPHILRGTAFVAAASNLSTGPGHRCNAVGCAHFRALLLMFVERAKQSFLIASQCTDS